MTTKTLEQILGVEIDLILTDPDSTLSDGAVRALKAVRQYAARVGGDMLAEALERMDRARNVLTNGKPTPECNWGMLDTSDLRQRIQPAALVYVDTGDLRQVLNGNDMPASMSADPQPGMVALHGTQQPDAGEPVVLYKADPENVVKCSTCGNPFYLIPVHAPQSGAGEPVYPPGYNELCELVDRLEETGRYVDDDGEATAALRDLLDSIKPATALTIDRGEPAQVPYDLVIRLLNNIEDTVNDKDWARIDTSLWNSVTCYGAPFAPVPAPQVAQTAEGEERPDEYVYFVDWYNKDAPDESEVMSFDMARHAWMAGMRFSDLFPVAAPPHSPIADSGVRAALAECN